MYDYAVCVYMFISVHACAFTEGHRVHGLPYVILCYSLNTETLTDPGGRLSKPQ